jgi:hypothetical protein
LVSLRLFVAAFIEGGGTHDSVVRATDVKNAIGIHQATKGPSTLQMSNSAYKSPYDSVHDLHSKISTFNYSPYNNPKRLTKDSLFEKGKQKKAAREKIKMHVFQLKTPTQTAFAL